MIKANGHSNNLGCVLKVDLISQHHNITENNRRFLTSQDTLLYDGKTKTEKAEGTYVYSCCKIDRLTETNLFFEAYTTSGAWFVALAPPIAGVGVI